MSDDSLDEFRALIQRDVNNRGLVRDPYENLFTVCRDDFANACGSIADHPHPSLAIVTGFYIPHADPPCGETDGPLGALFLARAGQALGIEVVLLSDSFCRNALEIGLQACDLEKTVPVVVLSAEASSFPRGAWEREWATLRVAAGSLARRDAERPDVRSHTERGNEEAATYLIALERVGPGSHDRCRNMHGRDITEEMAPAHLLFEDAARQIPPLCTIGIGDGGNEIGMGKIPSDVIARNISNGERIACRVPTDHLIVAGVSNWGAYALAAGVTVLRRRRLPASLFDVERERELLRVMVEQGPLVDGVTARPTVTVDGLAFDEYAEPLRQIGKLLEKEQWLT